MNAPIRRTPFRKILIANRGEIALRIMRTARRLGFGVVAVYSEADAGALHVREADEAVHIGGALPAQSYLNIGAIIAAAKSSGADAVHPGYGFLAENEDFAQACRDAGLVFIGPSPDAIRAMGNKAGAKEIMRAAGVPCVPGYQGADQSDTAMLAAAHSVGFPVMIKAAAGGGGRGMRLVTDAATFSDALRSARSEAQSAFGDANVILERALVDPRHILEGGLFLLGGEQARAGLPETQRLVSARLHLPHHEDPESHEQKERRGIQQERNPVGAVHFLDVDQDLLVAQGLGQIRRGFLENGGAEFLGGLAPFAFNFVACRRKVQSDFFHIAAIHLRHELAVAGFFLASRLAALGDERPQQHGQHDDEQPEHYGL